MAEMNAEGSGALRGPSELWVAEVALDVWDGD